MVVRVDLDSLALHVPSEYFALTPRMLASYYVADIFSSKKFL